VYFSTSDVTPSVQECRAMLPELEPPAAETPGAQAERQLYIALLGALADGLARTVDEALTLLRHASRLCPAGSSGDAGCGANV
jgi:hypothetical protein